MISIIDILLCAQSLRPSRLKIIKVLKVSLQNNWLYCSLLLSHLEKCVSSKIFKQDFLFRVYMPLSQLMIDETKGQSNLVSVFPKYLSFSWRSNFTKSNKGVVIIYGRGAVEFRKLLAPKMWPPPQSWTIFVPPLPNMCTQIPPPPPEAVHGNFAPPPSTPSTQILCPPFFHCPHPCHT